MSYDRVSWSAGASVFSNVLDDSKKHIVAEDSDTTLCNIDTRNPRYRYGIRQPLGKSLDHPSTCKKCKAKHKRIEDTQKLNQGEGQ